MARMGYITKQSKYYRAIPGRTIVRKMGLPFDLNWAFRTAKEYAGWGNDGLEEVRLDPYPNVVSFKRENK